MKIKIILPLAIVVVVSILLAFTLNEGGKEAVRCASYSVEKCPDSCVVCPPCPECSSLSCQTTDFCENIGFNRTWYSDIQKRMSEKKDGR